MGAVKCVDGRKVIPANFEKWGGDFFPLEYFLYFFFKKKNTSKPITVFSAISEMNEDLMLQMNIKTYIMAQRFWKLDRYLKCPKVLIASTDNRVPGMWIII